jgi:hypothetical protein
METGGANNTSTPKFRFLAKAGLPAKDERHMAHWAAALSENMSTQTATTVTIVNTREIFRDFIKDLCISCLMVTAQ